jgi:hypothetical protein
MESRVVCEHFHIERNCEECNKNQLKVIMILGKTGVKPGMEFTCSDCREKISGQRVLDGEYLYIVTLDRSNVDLSTFRCECCQDDHEDREM